MKGNHSVRFVTSFKCLADAYWKMKWTLTSSFNLGRNILPTEGTFLNVQHPHVIEDITTASIPSENKDAISKLGRGEVRPWLRNTPTLYIWCGLNLSPCLLLEVQDPNIIVASPFIQAPKDQHALIVKL